MTAPMRYPKFGLEVSAGGLTCVGVARIKTLGYVVRGQNDLDSLGNEESIVGGIGCALFLADMRSIAAGCRCFATVGVDALDGCDTREHAVVAAADHRDQQPRNGIGIG